MPRKHLTPTAEQLELLRRKNACQAMEELNVSRNVIRRWLTTYLNDVPRVRGRPCRSLPEGLYEQLGKATDIELSRRFRVPLSTIRNHRRRNEIAAYDSAASNG